MSESVPESVPESVDPTAASEPTIAPLKLSTKLAFGAGDLGAAMTANLLIFYLSPFLTDVAGLRPGLAAGTQLVGKFWDAINDPMVGVLSDRTRSRWGRRYPWMLFGAIPFALVFVLQWVVPRFSTQPNVNQWGLFFYYTLISILFNSCFTAVNLPYTALTPELTEDYNERTNLNSFRFVFSIGGSLLSVGILLAITLLIPEQLGRQLLITGIICAVIAIASLYWCIGGTFGRARAVAAQHHEVEEPVSLPIKTQLQIAFSNRPFLYVVGIYLCSWLSLQLMATVVPYFVRSWMQFENPEIVTLLVIVVIQSTAMLTLFIWSWVSQRVGKRATYFMGMGIWLIAQFGLFTLRPGQTPLMYFLAFLTGLGVSTAYLIPWSMLPDVIELDELNTGQRREGVFYSFMVFLQKIGLGLAIALVLRSLGWAGYIQPTATVPIPQQPDAVLWVIRLAIGPIPTFCLIAGIILAYFYPITEAVHAEVLLKLREQRSQPGSQPGSQPDNKRS